MNSCTWTMVQVSKQESQPQRRPITTSMDERVAVSLQDQALSRIVRTGSALLTTRLTPFVVDN
jgi:hypothetical protein